MTCSVSECGRPAVADGLCRGHFQRKVRGKPVSGELREYGRGPRAVFWDAVFDLLDLRATDDAGWKSARKRVEVYARRAFGRKGVRRGTL